MLIQKHTEGHLLPLLLLPYGVRLASGLALGTAGTAHGAGTPTPRAGSAAHKEVGVVIQFQLLFEHVFPLCGVGGAGARKGSGNTKLHSWIEK